MRDDFAIPVDGYNWLLYFETIAISRKEKSGNAIQPRKKSIMTIETIPNTDTSYYLLAFDKHGVERADDPDALAGKLLSDRVKQELRDQPITDVFLISHGWKGDIPAAKDQYNRWIGAMLECEADRERVREVRPGFKPLLIGLHWPSLPWGDEQLDTSGMSFDIGGDPLAPLVDDAADKIADTPAAKQALRTIFAAAMDDIAPPSLPDEVVEAYNILQREAGLSAEGPAGAPGSDAEAFDPEQVYQAEMADDAVAFGLPGIGGLLSVLQQLSFWKMKDRARQFGESGAGTLLRELMQIAAGGDVRFHLMGHSFGCIAVSATVAGAGGDAPLSQPVHSLFMVQGALSLWAYCSDIPVARGTPGYFHAIISGNKVSGPIVTTQSEHDTAVGRLYPLAAGIKRQVSFAPGELPKYGALGSYGIRGPGVEVEDLAMLPLDDSYDFSGGTSYNLESSEVIREGSGASGAHSDIDRPEVGHAFWAAVMS